MSSQILLSGGDKWYSYSGTIFGDVTVPASIQMVLIPSTGLRDSYVKIQPFYGNPILSTVGSQLGTEVKLDDVVVYNTQSMYPYGDRDHFELFIPRQSKLEVISLNTSANNTQIRGVALIGYYL